VFIIFSCFFFGVNLNDKLRGSTISKLAFTTNIGDSPVAFDPLIGMVTADNFKRKQQISYVNEVVDSMVHATHKTVLIAGWWQNEIKYFSLEKQNPNVSYLYFADEKELSDSIAKGNTILFLPEQDIYNDMRYKKTFTNKIAQPLLLSN
jgi:ribosomal protein L7Ae-like RNA K-turn-binding protein